MKRNNKYRPILMHLPSARALYLCASDIHSVIPHTNELNKKEILFGTALAVMAFGIPSLPIDLVNIQPEELI